MLRDYLAQARADLSEIQKQKEADEAALFRAENSTCGYSLSNIVICRINAENSKEMLRVALETFKSEFPNAKPFEY